MIKMIKSISCLSLLLTAFSLQAVDLIKYTHSKTLNISPVLRGTVSNHLVEMGHDSRLPMVTDACIGLALDIKLLKSTALNLSLTSSLPGSEMTQFHNVLNSYGIRFFPYTVRFVHGGFGFNFAFNGDCMSSGFLLKLGLQSSWTLYSEPDYGLLKREFFENSAQASLAYQQMFISGINIRGSVGTAKSFRSFDSTLEPTAEFSLGYAFS